LRRPEKYTAHDGVTTLNFDTDVAGRVPYKIGALFEVRDRSRVEDILRISIKDGYEFSSVAVIPVEKIQRHLMGVPSADSDPE
jgi:hypothetical protein